MFNNSLVTMEVNKPLLEQRAFESFSVVTEIADQMYRSYGIAFRAAHHFVSYMVRKAIRINYNLKNITREFFAECYEEVFKEPFTKDFSAITQALDPRHFVACRDIYGGTGPNAMNAMITSSKRKMLNDVEWYENALRRLADSDSMRETLIKNLLV